MIFFVDSFVTDFMLNINMMNDECHNYVMQIFRLSTIKRMLEKQRTEVDLIKTKSVVKWAILYHFIQKRSFTLTQAVRGVT